MAVCYGTTRHFVDPNNLRPAAKVMSIWALALWALLNGGPWLLVAALLLSSIGDGFLALKDTDKWLLPGMGAFFAAHVAYLFLFHGVLTEGINFTAVPQFILLVIGFTFLASIFGKLGDMRWPVLAYAMVILAMGGAALSLPPEYAWAMYGALAFIASDAILSLELFVLPEDSATRRVTSPLLWFLYWGAQAAITYAFIA